MAVTRQERWALIAAGVFAAAMPLVLLATGGARAPQPEPAAAPLVVPALPPLAAAYQRPLFGAAPGAAEEALPEDAPALVGIVGRLGEDAVALVRGSEGSTRALRVGESVDGWRLASLAIDAAFFTRGTQRVRVPLPAG